ncbi:MAG TPA: glycosyltransferase family 39 protein [Pyrinomonadaceae bacterium]|nr:glycosyltransferase family 39 protein [Pyrinomonadaceae bacterium]HMP64423.1 glycosyltransferase family 39 protein [Pyrinomonadaceae bacterium]
MSSKQYKTGSTGTGRFDIGWLASCAAITALAFFLRFYWLALKPFHHDEGVNGWFLTNLFRTGVYKYDPENYHGPTLYYISLAFSKAFGLDTVTVRWSVAVWGVLIVVLAFYLRPYLGRIGSLAAAAFLALSPGMVFISRYFIHEIFFVFLSLTIVMSVVYFIERRKAGPFAIGWMFLLLLVCFLPSALNLARVIAGEGSDNFVYIAVTVFALEAVLVFFVVWMLAAWRDGRPIYFLLAMASVALFFATKETAFITLGTMAIAVLLVWLWRRNMAATLDKGGEDDIADAGLNGENFREAIGTGADRWLIWTAGILMLIYVFVLFFSSFFTYPEGVKKALEAYAIWTKTGTRDHTDNGWQAYLEWAWQVEAPIVLLSAVGTAIAFLKARHRFAMFAGLWTLGLFLAYSIIPYKTPWLALSFILPACLAAGYAINEIAKYGGRNGIAAAAAIGTAACGVLAYQTYDHNFVRYDDEKMPYVYAHTRREFLDMVADIERFAEASGKGEKAAVDIVSPDYWPLVWYLRDYREAVFHGQLVDRSSAEMIVAKRRDQENDVTARYSANYAYYGTYGLRPGVELMLLVRKDLVGSEGVELYKIGD